MKYVLLPLLMVFALSACQQETAEDMNTDEQQNPQMEAQKQPDADISTATLAEIDPLVEDFSNGVDKAQKRYDEDPSQANKEALVKAYVAFGDYMTYESPVSPRKGKYRRALQEYRHALELDPSNEKVLAEIKQIEDIYKSMGRPIPNDA